MVKFFPLTQPLFPCNLQPTKNMIREIIAPFERLTYVREDGNQAIYKIFRPTKHLFVNKKNDGGRVVGFRAWKMPNSGSDERMGWRSFRFDRIASRKLTFV